MSEDETIISYNPTNKLWPRELRLVLSRTPDNGYWWVANGAGNESADAAVNAVNLRPGGYRSRGYASREAAIRAAKRAGWTLR